VSINSLLSHWRADPTVGGNFAAWEEIPARQAQFVPFPEAINIKLIESVKSTGIAALYSHQKKAWDLIQSGRNVVLATDTASGKTLAYNLPILDYLLSSPQERALYLFPTKALAQDQLAVLRSMTSSISAESSPIAPATYDGDTNQSARPTIRRSSRLIISNPDMLHIGILPRHTAWSDFFAGLRYIVIDEMHICRGVFGSHVANVIRRLKRVAKFYGSDPQFILTSATIGNPSELAEKIIEKPVTLINEDASARGAKHFIIYNPPIIDAELGLRASMIAESVRITEDLLSYGLQTILFGRTRRTVEVILRYLKPPPSAPPPLSPSPKIDEYRGEKSVAVRAYRSGYLPEHRREIERGLRNGDVRVVVATTALELGIDIGGMGATVQAGYPGTIASTWQQAGRAGRGTDASLSLLVASPSPSDQYLARNPDYFFGRNPEHALINPDNLLILLKHLQCAAFEIPFGSNEAFGSMSPAQVAEILSLLHESGVLHKSKDQFFWMGDKYPSAEISLRSASAQPIILQDQSISNRIIGEVDGAAAPWMVHPGAIYLHEAETYLVEELDLENRWAILSPAEVDYFTRPRRETEIQVLEIREGQKFSGGSKAHGELAVITQVSGFHLIRWDTHEKLGFQKLDLPPNELITAGFWLTLSEEIVAQLRDKGLWRGDRNYYGANWERQRQAALNRDQKVCQVCGVGQGSVSHHVHHKIPFKAFDSYLDANRLENLLTVCPSCHQKVESAVRMRSGLSGLAYALGHLAPLLLMCDSRDLGVHADPQSAIADGSPVVVIYEMIPAGIGFSQRLYECHDDLIASARQLILGCPCQDGCPSCVGPGGEEGSGGKSETLAIIDHLAE